MGFSGASQQAPLSGATAIARLFSISASKEKGKKKNSTKLDFGLFVSVLWGLGFKSKINLL